LPDTPPTFRKGQLLRGPHFDEPMRVQTVRQSSGGDWVLGLSGQKSERFREVSLGPGELAELQILEPNRRFDGDGGLLRLGLEAYALGIAWEFNPYFGLSVSRVDPLPHQLEAVYDHLLKLSRVRFLLADDAGAGKTIMAGLLLRELQLRGLAERILVVCPANLAFQWQRELNEKFHETFRVLKGGDLRAQFGVNQWQDHNRIITSLDLAKRADILPGLRQTHWHLVIVDEAHRMSARDASHKSQRYKLGELLRDTTDHLLLLTATPHKGDPENFTLFLQLLDEDVYADVSSIREAMENQHAPFYLRRTKEAMVAFPKHSADGSLSAAKLFTRRIPKTAGFNIDDAEFDLYTKITDFVKRQSYRAANQQGNDLRARAVGFLMALYQRRLASSTCALRRSLENRANRLEKGLAEARKTVRQAPGIPSAEKLEELELEEMEEKDRERIERLLEAITLTGRTEDVLEEIRELRDFALQAKSVEEDGAEAKLSKLQELLQQEGFFGDPGKRLLIFTEFKDTLNYLVEKLRAWNFRVGMIHGGMKPGGRDEPGTRIHTEQQFRDGAIQVVVATEAAGEGINLQCCNILFNYDIPWNPNRLEQRMGRIHRYGQQKDCLIFNFVATNTIEGRVLNRLLEKLQEIRNALDDDAVFNVVGEVLPASHMERVLRDYYAKKFGENELEDRMLRNVDERRFRNICQNALEGLAAKRLNLEMLVERNAQAKEHRMVPETIARFMREAAGLASLELRQLPKLNHAFEPGRTPGVLRRYEREVDWKLSAVADRYARITTDRGVAEEHSLEWVTPGHPLFEAIRRHACHKTERHFASGACFYSLQHDAPARLDFYRARVVDGLGVVIHEKLFAVELSENSAPEKRELSALGNFTPARVPGSLPAIATAPEAEDWLRENALAEFLQEVREEKLGELDRVAEHAERSLTALIERADTELGRAAEEEQQQKTGAKGRLSQAEERYDELVDRRKRHRDKLRRQRTLSLQSVSLLASALILPHPERETPEVHNLRPNLETEAIAMQVVMEHERAQGRQVKDVSAQNLGYDITSRAPDSDDLRLIEVKGLAAAEGGDIMLTPNERRVAEDRRDCYWLYIVTNCGAAPVLQKPIENPARYNWHEVSQVKHYRLSVNALTSPLQLREKPPSYGADT